MAHCIGEQLFENQVQFELHIAAKAVLTAELCQFGRQWLQLPNISVFGKFCFAQNCLIVPHGLVGFNRQPFADLGAAIFLCLNMTAIIACTRI